MVTKYHQMEKIDFVILWVDDTDPEWQSVYSHYSKLEFGDARSVCFRDWGTLKYWFRGVECFTPWVNKVFFVTCGHYPEWLNLDCQKLRFVKHSDFIPSEYLPTFSSHTIELNLHRIDGLSDKFVYFNDDTFIINNTPQSRFFKDGVPCDMAVLNAIQPIGTAFEHIKANNIALINKIFHKKETIRKNWTKWFNPVYGTELLRTFGLLGFPYFTGFLDPHLPNPFLKKSFADVWNTFEESLHKTCLHKFRSIEDVNQYIIRYVQLLHGDFHPINIKKTSVALPVNNNLNRLSDIIKHQSKSIVCINDSDVDDFNNYRKQLINAFESILPNKSLFEL